MKKSVLFLVFTIVVFSFATPSFASGGTRLFVFPAKKVEITKDVKGDVLVIGKSVRISSKITGNVSVIGGNIEVFGQVSGNCVSIGGSVETKGGTIKGDTVSVGEIFGKNRLYFLLLNTFFWIFTIGFGAFYYGDRIKENAFEFADDFLRLFFFGFYSLVALTVLAIISFALIKVGVGIILFIAVFFIFFALYIFSVLTLFYFFGDTVSRLLNFSIPLLLKMIIGLALYQALKFIPLIGFLTFVVLLSASFGASIYSKFGTFKPWFGLPRFWGE